jgi:hypothetical protein
MAVVRYRQPNTMSATPSFLPPYSPLPAVSSMMQQRGYAILAAADVVNLIENQESLLQKPSLDGLVESWNHLAIDAYLKDGGRYRKRRHSSIVLEGQQLRESTHRAHWQPLEYNALHGGMHRWFEPISPEVLAHGAWQQLLLSLPKLFEVKSDAVKPWFIEAHQFRIDTEGGIGRPTPEGAHRDGVDFVAVFLIARNQIKGGETRIFEAQGASGQRFTLTEPWSLLLLDDARMIHETTPIQPIGQNAYRDTLVVTYRRNGFIGEA